MTRRPLLDGTRGKSRSVRRRLLTAALLLTALVRGGSTQAQEVVLPEPVTAPKPNAKEAAEEVPLDVDTQIDLSNIVTSAAKGVTTVQEAPSIITVITAEDIKSRGFRLIGEALATIPGWVDTYALGNQTEDPLVRGIGQSTLFMHDGVSMFDPFVNTGTYGGRSQPLESIKRMEIVTGPGGVLWGANSFLGIVNVISKDAEDIPGGVEASAQYGDGPGNKQDMRAYAMFGHSFFSGTLKIFQHISYENYIGPIYTLPQLVVIVPPPQPRGPTLFGSLATSNPPRSQILVLDGKYSLGPFHLYYSVPLGTAYKSLGFGTSVTSRNQWPFFDRYGILEYKGRYAHDKVGLTAKAYYVQFDREFNFFVVSANPIFPVESGNNGGLQIDFGPELLVQRFGGTVDAEFNLTRRNRLLVGGEAFDETESGSVTRFFSPTNGAQIPQVCPVDERGVALPRCPRTFINPVNRPVGALYLDDQWQLARTFTLDGGVRLQKAFGVRSYDVTPLYSAAAVWNFLPNYHIKASYATGFRPPVFNNTDTPAGGLNYSGNPDLKNETSQSFQGEINARLLRNERKIRELEFRLDYSYTVLSNLIASADERYVNLGKHAVHAVEAESRLYLTGDHVIQLAYTYTRQETTDFGQWRALPHHGFVLSGVFNLIKRVLDVNANLNVFGASEDFNRFPALSSGGLYGSTSTGRVSDLTIDRLTPVALLQLGMRVRFFNDHVALGAQFYNVLNQHYFYPDRFNELVPRNEIRPTPAPGFNFFTSLTFHP